MPRTVNRRLIHGTSLRQIGWLRYPDGVGRMFQAVEHPRLTYIMRAYEAEPERKEAFWLVDGAPVDDVDAAIEALNVPPAISAEEREVLDLVPAEWTSPTDLRAAVTDGVPAASHTSRIRLLRSLADKGCLQVESDRIRRTPECA